MSTLPLTYKYFLGGAAAGGFLAYSYQKTAQKTLVAQLRDEYDEKFSDVSKAAFNKARQATDSTKSALIHTKDYTADSLKSTINDARDSFKSTIDNSKEAIDSKVKDAKDTVDSTIEQSKDTVESKYNNAKDSVQSTYNDAKNTAEASYKDSKNAVEDKSQEVKSSWLSWTTSNKDDPELRKQELDKRLKHSLSGFGENAQFFAEEQFSDASDLLQKTKNKYYETKANTEDLINQQVEKAKEDFDSAKKELDSFTTHWYQFGRKVDENAKQKAQKQYEYAENVYNNAKYELDHFKNAVYKSADTFKNEYSKH
ncbi:uncharacterized protein ASCRUDRAFT_82781 [Ascoidea rubescens DSM 1968]|uniref:Uncharacterized protein n=1 Tax=Ascoidea rubescens DSM 1968 TaxID=1344418 RepID=A0A1D2V9Z0_9ASCO|nr:hypothetical protein ASCRUDRAFT_82781 [Ascoidea rubescens DSM 1968]ODV58399.1 hypothetical protein ASCRUDRAFT_82781 [Ascoidea rubescens DSM 1968]